MMKIWLPLIIIFLATSLKAQLSPGDLQKSHQDLEGLKNCTQCHVIGQKISPQKCLDCHTILRERILAQKGLHSQPNYQTCEKCHVEHHGRDFDLIWWPDGKENFDHTLTGFKLQGKHAHLKCQDCHRPEFIQNKKLFLEKHKKLDRTFLGLQTNCLNCHYDEHRQQLGEDCQKCHNQDNWKPAAKFDHNKTNYPLTGKHVQTSCEKCHREVTDNQFPEDSSFSVYTGIKHANCSDCHKDVHSGKFGKNCSGCHNTSGWQNYSKVQFNHDNTKFPLKGKHRAVACEKCHLPGAALQIANFNRCSDCHSDYHQGQFAERQQEGACKECHTVWGFTPSFFTIEKHNLTDFPLKGSHLAIPCNACHKKTRIHSEETIQFKFASNRCISCHKDVHLGQVDKYLKKSGCEYCHSVESWMAVKFDHKQTGFTLEGKHANVACNACHKAESQTAAPGHLKFLNLSAKCQDCHKDPHHAQFAKITPENTTIVNCQKCHTPDNWLAKRFDHNRDASFKLEGAHRFVKCEKCHPIVVENNQSFVRYRPLASACNACHGNKEIRKEG
jgi:hypothetical protein